MTPQHNRPYPAKPYKQNGIFTGGDETSLNACVGKNGGPYGLTDYARGYMMAGRRLTDSLEDSSNYVDLVVYPLVFVYRHAVELYLKQLATHLPALSARPSAVSHTHQLTDNWRVTRESLTRHAASFDADRTLIPMVDAVIRDLIEIDEDGQTFRFPHARDGNRFLQNTSLINVRVFAEALDAVCEALDFWIDVAARMLEAKHELP